MRLGVRRWHLTMLCPKKRAEMMPAMEFNLLPLD